MELFKNNKISIVLIYLHIFLVVNLMEYCYKVQGFRYDYLAFMMLIGTAVYAFYEYVLRKRIHKVLFTVVLLVGLVFAYIIQTQYLSDFFQGDIVGNILAINNATMEGASTDFYQFTVILTIAIPILTLILLYFAGKGLYNSIVIFTVIATLNFWYTNYTDEVKGSIFRFMLLCIFTLCVNSYLRYKRKVGKRGIKLSIKVNRIITYALVITLVFTIGISIMPQEFKGKYVLDVQGRFVNKFNKANDPKAGYEFTFDMSSTGYNSTSVELGGPVNINSDLVLKVKSDKPYYLAGDIKDLYDGRKWMSTFKDYKLLMERQTVKYPDLDRADSYAEQLKTLTVYPSGIKTSTFFAPYYVIDISPDKGRVFVNAAPNFISSEIQDKPYIVRFRPISENSEAMLKRYFQNNPGKNIETEQFKQNNYGKYLQIPDVVSPELYELVYTITAKYNNDYDKAMAIKQYLNTKYPYSLQVSEVPKDYEFIDYFLNVEKKGYCTYFATAATVMCRIAGIPARYVEGFYMTPYKDDNGIYQVTNENAHAWTEIFLANDFKQGAWLTLDCVPSAPQNIQSERLAKEKEKENQGGATGTGVDPRRPQNKGGQQQQTNNSQEQWVMPNWLKAIIISTSALIFAILIRLLSLMLIRRRAVKSESIIPLYSYAFRRIRVLKLRKPASLSEMEFLKLIEEKDISSALLPIADGYYREFYGKKTSEHIEKLPLFISLEEAIKKNEGSFVYYLRRFFF